jgi:hypothetical protein
MSEETTRQERLDNMIRKVEGLLKKATATTNEHEADAFFAKAQQLMTEHGIEETMLALDKDEVKAEEVIHQDFNINRSGFFESMVRLATACAATNDVEVLVKQPKSWGTEAGVRFIGMESDITKVKMLYVALLAHCVRERKNAPDWVRQQELYEKGFIQRWRRDFSLGYASRIRERLMEIKRAEEAAADDRSDGRFLPALRDKNQLVRDYAANMTAAPKAQRQRKGPMSDAFNGGRTAAERADLGQSRVGGTDRPQIGN